MNGSEMSTPERRAQVIKQTQRIAELATGLARIYSGYDSFVREACDDAAVERIGERTARHLEMLIEICAPTTGETEEYLELFRQEPVFREAQKMWPNRADAMTH